MFSVSFLCCSRHSPYRVILGFLTDVLWIRQCGRTGQGNSKMLTEDLTLAVIAQVNDMRTRTRANIALVNKSEIIPNLNNFGDKNTYD
jgi:hypothetical protein